MTVYACDIGSSSVSIYNADTNGYIHRKGLGTERLVEEATDALRSLDIGPGDTVVHRIVIGGDRESPYKLTGKRLETLRKYERYASLHQPVQLDVACHALETFPADHYAYFDTSFHTSIPRHRKRYGLHRDDKDLARFGYHGINCEGVTEGLRGGLVVCHLGSGCSVTAVQDGESVATSMGRTPLDGVLMRTRPGSLDPGVVLEIVRRKGSVEAADTYFNEECGWEGMSGESLKSLVNNRPGDDVVQYFVESVAENVAKVTTHLEGRDTVVFTGGVGENNEYLRRAIIESVSFLGFDSFKVVEACEEQVMVSSFL